MKKQDDGNLMITAGKNYKLKHPNSSKNPAKLYIDYILDNPVDNAWFCKLVICREYFKPKRRWLYYSYQYYILAMYNNWPYGEGENYY